MHYRLDMISSTINIAIFLLVKYLELLTLKYNLFYHSQMIILNTLYPQ